MDLSKPLLYFTVEKFSHHFVIKDMSPMGQAAAEAFARNYIQFGMIKIGRFFKRGPVKVFAAKVTGDNEIRFHIGQWNAWKSFLANRGVNEKCYKEVEYGFEAPAPLNATLKEGWQARDYQIPIIEYLKSDKPSTRKLVEIQPGKGKSQPGYAKVLTPDSFVRIDSLVPGQLVVAQDGSIVPVEEVYENGLRPMMDVTLEDGRSCVADKEHLWRINYYQDKKLTQCVVNTDHIRVLVDNGKKVYLPLLQPDSALAGIADECLTLVADAVEGKADQVQLEKMEHSGYFSRSIFIRNLLQYAAVDIDEGTVRLKAVKNDTLQSIFWATGFICKWLEGEECYDLWHESIENFFDSTDDITTAKAVRAPFYGAQITAVKSKEVKEEAFCIKIRHPLHLYITDNYIVTHNTFCASSAIASMGKRMIAFLKPKYLEKWVRDLKAILDIDPEDIEVIQGSGSLMRVMAKASEGKLDCKAILVSNRTYQHFISTYEKEGKAILDQGYDCLPHEFIQLTGCGVRLVDEVHEDFHLNFKIDLYTHVPWAISLSATLVSDDAFISRMHEVAYEPEIRYNGLDYDKYVDSYALKYRIVGGDKIRVNEIGSPNYSHMAFEKSVTRNNKLLMDYLALINKRFEIRHLSRVTKKGQRCLIYAASIQMCTLICEYLKARHKNLDIRRYVEDDPYDNLMQAEVCVSTIGSAGTGHDIPDLITVILTVAIASKASNIQGFGRLRKLDNTDVVFEYFTCLDIPKHVEYYERKELLLAGMAKSTSSETLSMPIG